MDGNTPTNASTERRVRRTLADEIVNLKGELTAANQRAATDIAALQKKLADAENSLKFANERAASAQKEVDQISAVLDVLEGAPARTIERAGRYGSETIDLAPITRLSAFLAQRK